MLTEARCDRIKPKSAVRRLLLKGDERLVLADSGPPPFVGWQQWRRGVDRKPMNPSRSVTCVEQPRTPHAILFVPNFCDTDIQVTRGETAV